VPPAWAKVGPASEPAADEEAHEDAEEACGGVVEQLARDEPPQVRPLRRVVGLERLRPPEVDDRCRGTSSPSGSQASS
jgi:hypothetical protein